MTAEQLHEINQIACNLGYEVAMQRLTSTANDEQAIREPQVTSTASLKHWMANHGPSCVCRQCNVKP